MVQGYCFFFLVAGILTDSLPFIKRVDTDVSAEQSSGKSQMERKYLSSIGSKEPTKILHVPPDNPLEMRESPPYIMCPGWDKICAFYAVDPDSASLRFRLV